jgi:hypothetical protein
MDLKDLLDDPEHDGKVPCRDGGGDPNDWMLDQSDAERVPDYLVLRRKAKQRCWDCPLAVRGACLEEGMKPENIRFGIWGGYTERQRLKFRAETARRALRRARVNDES